MAWRARAAALLLACAAVAAQAADDPVVARLGGRDVKLSQIKPFLDGLDAMTRDQAAKSPQALATLVRAELGRIALLDEAAQKQWDKRPDVAQQIERARQAVIAATYLAAMAPLPDGFPSDSDVAQAYEKNRDQFLVPRQYHLAQIFIAEPAGADNAALDKARALAKQARVKGTDFAALAKQAGDPQDGDLGWLPENRIVPEILAAVHGMTDDEVGDPVHTGAGWHVVKMLGTRPAGIRPLAEVRDDLVARLRQARTQDEEKRYFDQLLSKQDAEINEIALKQALQPAK